MAPRSALPVRLPMAVQASAVASPEHLKYVEQNPCNVRRLTRFNYKAQTHHSCPDHSCFKTHLEFSRRACTLPICSTLAARFPITLPATHHSRSPCFATIPNNSQRDRGGRHPAILVVTSSLGLSGCSPTITPANLRQPRPLPPTLVSPR